ncbi:hypothetical protein [Caldivirga maquilingensis]|uniref:DUF131 domain-containing protein n=1 Tax=Caldivirga maquilingensis (strain ATCC 700844 / DSM 13496 / JCM 10307 / IC-167) TaxID=397948 RepID=A8M9T9_CALMQ|nr:hypothetical protein [Caldivirga maquilingensis]ABW02410.1 hypothetical protein Cmaq_1587 [Caldivirga maquilingensis IC-167]
MRLYQVGLILIIIAVLIPLLAVILLALTAPSTGVTWGGAVLVFPIPVAIVIGNKPSIITALSWVMVVVFIAMIIIYIITLLYHRRLSQSSV